MTKQHKFTDAEKDFMREYTPGHSYKEIQAAFVERFGWGITLGQVSSFVKRYNLSTGRTGRFEKGHTPPNKGMKGFHPQGSEKGWFKKGHTPANTRMIGEERINKDGYTEVKVGHNTWALKHRVIWENANGEIPKDCVVIFKDNDKTNITIDNLMLVKKAVHAEINKTGLNVCEGGLKETAAKIAELRIETVRRGRSVRSN